MHRPEKGPVRHLSPELTQAGIKLRFAGPAQHILPQAFGHGAHLLGNGRIFVGEICMAAPGVDEAQRVAIVSGPAGNGLHHRGSGVCEVDEAEISHRRGALIHQPGGLSKVDVFSELPHLGDQYRGHFSMIIKAVEDGPHQHLIGGGGGEPRAGQHIGAHIGVKTSKPQVQLVEPGSNAADQSGGGPVLGGYDLQLFQVDALFAVAFRVNTDHIAVIFGADGHRIQRHCGGQHPPLLVVGVVATDLAAARCGIEFYRPLPAKAFAEFLRNMEIPLPLPLPAAGIQPLKSLVIRPRVQCSL